MARPLRLEFAGALYHLTSRGDRRESIYEDDADRKGFLSILGDVCSQQNWLCHAYCLMTNHYHLLVETPGGNLSRGMRQLNGVYTQRCNRRHGRAGHVFQGRYKAILVDKQAYLLELARYIVLNPVRAGMVRLVEDWPWSSYRAMAGQAKPPDWLRTEWLLATFGGRKGEARAAYRCFVAGGERLASPWDELRKQVFLGDEGFVGRMQARVKGDHASLTEIPKCQRWPKAGSLEDYSGKALSRNEAIAEAYASGGYTLKEVGDHFGLHYSRVSRIVSMAKRKT